MKPRDYAHRLQVMARQHEQTKVRNESPSVQIDGATATVRLYDLIDSWGDFFGVSAREFASVIDDLPANVAEIRLHINSPGGDVFEGLAILNTLRAHRARVVAIVDGLAASAASFIAAGVDELIMAPNSELMIHDAWGLVVGNADDMRTMADLLDHSSDNIASIYAAKAGGDVAEWRDAMRRETWYSAEEAVAAGLADSIAENGTDDVSNRFDLSIFNYAGREQAPAPSVAPVEELAASIDNAICEAAKPEPIDVAGDVAEFLHLIAIPA